MKEIMKIINPISYLVIGNSRLHWACKKGESWEFIHTSHTETPFKSLDIPLAAWAAVGPIPSNIDLNKSRQINLQDIPLFKIPPWLGVDRALSSWGALQKAKKHSSMFKKGILIADAGTVLSITKISAKGEFEGGQLSAGLDLQLKAMSKGTENLAYPSIKTFPSLFFPTSTTDAMLQGCLQSLIGTVLEAQAKADVPVWLCGGDSALIYKALIKKNIEVFHYPNLVLEGMIDLKN